MSYHFALEVTEPSALSRSNAGLLQSTGPSSEGTEDVLQERGCPLVGDTKGDGATAFGSNS